MRIDDFKSTIANRGGLAISNRFVVNIAHPSGGSFYPARYQRGGTGVFDRAADKGAQNDFSAGGRDISLLCDSVRLPGRQIGTDDDVYSAKPIRKPMYYVNDDVDMTFYLTNDYYVWDYFNSWIDSIVVRDISLHKFGIRFKKSYTTDITIEHIGRNNTDVAKSVRLLNAYPITIGSVELANSTTDSIAQCSISFAYDDWEETSTDRRVDRAAVRTAPTAPSINSITSFDNLPFNPFSLL